MMRLGLAFLTEPYDSEWRTPRAMRVGLKRPQNGETMSVHDQLSH